MAEQPLAASALRVFSSVDEVIDAVGDKLGPSPWMTIDQRAVDTFAEVTGDWQPLHCDPEVAAGSPYGGTIAHGYFTMSLVSSFARQLYRVDGVAHVINYGIDRLRFPAPVPVGARIRASATVMSTSHRGDMVLVGVNYVIEVDGSSRPCLVADTVVALVLEPSAANAHG